VSGRRARARSGEPLTNMPISRPGGASEQLQVLATDNGAADNGPPARGAGRRLPCNQTSRVCTF